MTNLTEQWVNIYKSKKHGSYWTGTFGYKTKEEAVKDLADNENYLTTVNIEDMLNFQTQNAKLKELLKEVRGKLKYINTPRNNHNIFGNDLMKKINQVLGEE